MSISPTTGALTLPNDLPTYAQADPTNNLATPEIFQAQNDAMRAGVNNLWIRGTTGGTANAVELTASADVNALVNGAAYFWKATATTTAAATFNPNGLGAKPLVDETMTAIGAAGEVVLGQWYLSTYDSASGGRFVTRLGLTPAAAAATYLPKAGGNLTGALNETAVTVASAATTDIGAAAGNAVRITGTTTITALGTAQAGARRHLTFAGVLTLTHNAASLILPGGANIVTSAGDVAEMESLGVGNWRCVGYQRANGQALAGADLASAYTNAKAIFVAGANTILTPNDTAKTITVTAATATAPSLLDLLAWYDASTLASLYQANGSATPVTTTGQTVGTWQDRSGAGRHLEQAAAGARPTYRASDGPSGAPCVRFDGTDDTLARLVNLSQPLHCFLVFRFGGSGFPSDRNIFGAEPSGSWTIRTGTGAGQIGVHESGVAYRITAGSPGTAWKKLQVYTGGGTGFTIMDGATAPASFPTTATIGTLMLMGTGAAIGTTVDIAEVLLYGAQQAGVASAQTNAYLAAKYGAL